MTAILSQPLYANQKNFLSPFFRRFLFLGFFLFIFWFLLYTWWFRLPWFWMFGWFSFPAARPWGAQARRLGWTALTETTTTAWRTRATPKGKKEIWHCLLKVKKKYDIVYLRWNQLGKHFKYICVRCKKHDPLLTFMLAIYTAVTHWYMV